MAWFRSFRRRLRRSLLPPRLLVDIEAIRLTQGKILAELNRSRSLHPLSLSEFGVFSQWGEDGILQRLIAELTIEHPTFIEFGVEDFVESNCRFLMMNNNWRGFVIDSSPEKIASLKSADWWWKFDLRAESAFITADNVNECLRRSEFDSDLGVLSIDVDGVDYWLWEAINVYAPRILIIEYNALFGCERKITVPYDPLFSRRRKHYSELYYGASLPALAHLGARKGYALVGTTSSGINAFFVRNDLIGTVKTQSVEEAFHDSMVRQSRNRNGRLDYRDRAARYELIAGLPVVNVETGRTEVL